MSGNGDNGSGAEVVDIVSRQHHVDGPARCLNCRHEWRAVLPWDGRLGSLECPSCGHMKGILPYVYDSPCDTCWTCNCGNALFEVNPRGIYCQNCGTWQSPP